MSNPEFLDLDAFAPARVFRYKGVDHEVQPLSVEDFLENVRVAKNLGAEATIEDEIEAIVGMLKRLIPSMGEADLRKMPLGHLRKIMEFAQAEGEAEANAEAAKAGENPPKAGE